METQKPTNDSWDEYISGNFIKAANIASENDAYVGISTEEVENADGVKRVRLTLERNEIEWDFDLNKTNAKKCKELGIKTPKELIGKKFYFRKALVRNPKTNQEVESLRIWKIE